MFQAIQINNVNNRFLPLTESVSTGLESEPKLSDFHVIRQIGDGSFGKVYLVKHKKTNVTYAMKEINKNDKNNQEGKPYFRREIEIMYKVHHPNVVKLYSHFEDERNCYFIMEYVENGNLFVQPSWTKSECFLPHEVAKYMKEIISAVYYLHNMSPPIIHRDIKPENVLIDSKGIAKLTDFGWSNYVNSEFRSTYCGTPVYLAPEMITEIGHDEHLDIWCIGILMFELLTGTVPFKGKDFESLNNNILSLKIQWPNDINIDAKNLISKILKSEPKDRISLEEMLKHPFFLKNTSISSLDTILLKPIHKEYSPFIISKDIPEMNASTKEKYMNECNINIEDTHYNNINEVNFKELYDRLMESYDMLSCSYNQLINEKDELHKELDEVKEYNISLQYEKKNLLQEIECKNKHIINLNNEIALNKERKKIEEQFDDAFKNDNTNHSNIIETFQQHIELINKQLNMLIECSTMEQHDKYKTQLINTKELFESEINKIKEESIKERDKLIHALHLKDIEISKLMNNQQSIKESENKKYEKIITKYEKILKEKDSEIETLHVKNKKLEMMYNTYIKKKKEKTLPTKEENK